MYLGDEYDVTNLLPRGRSHIKGDESLATFLRVKDPDATLVKPNQHLSSYFNACLLLLTFYCHYLTADELFLFFPDSISVSGVKRALNRCAEKKLMKAETCHESAYILSRHAYCLTSTGFEYVRQNIVTAGVLSNTDKPRRSGGKANLHDFGVGLTFLHFLSSPFVFDFAKEEMIGAGAKNVKRSLCVDLHLQTKYLVSNGTKLLWADDVISFCDQNDPSSIKRVKPSVSDIYIEQDNGVEPISTLAAKIGSYRNHGKDVSNACCIFSYFFPNAGDSSASSLTHEFSKKQITLLKKEMELYECPSLSQYLHLAKTNATLKCVDTAKSLSRVISLSRGLDLKKEELDRYLSDLSELHNPYRVRSLNQRQLWYTENRYHLLLELFNRYVCDPKCASFDEMQSLLSGFSVFQVPTALLSCYIERMFSYDFDFGKSMYDSVAPYFPEIDAFDNGALYVKKQAFTMLSSGKRHEHPRFAFKNVFHHADGYVAIEDIGIDLSAAVRVLYADNYQHPAEDEGVARQIVCIVQSERQACRFYSLLLHKRETVTVQPDLDGIYFLLASDIGKPDKLFGVMRDRMKADEPFVPVYQKKVWESDELWDALSSMTDDDFRM